MRPRRRHWQHWRAVSLAPLPQAHLFLQLQLQLMVMVLYQASVLKLLDVAAESASGNLAEPDE